MDNITDKHNLLVKVTPNIYNYQGIFDMDKIEQIYVFLNKLRESGEINMLEATPRIQKEFGMSKHESRRTLLDWLKSYCD